ASVNGKRVVIANPTYFINSRYPLPLRAHQLITKLEEEGKTVIVVFVDVYFAGLIAVADELKASSIAAVQDLKKMGLDVVMLTGDNEKPALAIARKTGIKYFRAKMTPQDKAEFLYQLQQDRNGVIMVGDGINDAPALAVANVGVALGTGSDITME